VNLSVIVQLAPGANDAPQVCVIAKSPVTEIPAMESVAVPLLVSVTVRAVLVVPSGSPPKLMLEGASVTAGPSSVTVAWSLLLLFATLVAVTVTLVTLLTTDGAVYRPEALILPAAAVAGLSDHVTAEFVAPETDALNSTVCPASRVAVFGVTATVSGTSVTVLLAHLLASTTLQAFTVIV